MLIFHSLILLISSGTYAATIEKRYALAPQISPSFPSSMPTPTNVVTSYNSGPYDTSTTLSTKPLTGFPTTWVPADTTSQEVKDMYNKIDWTKVPNAPVRKQNADGSWVSTSDGASDPYCWWSSTNCVTPKASYLPKDIYTCPNKGDWGLNYDDGPFNRYTDSNAAEQNPYAEPALYNYLASNNLHSTLFYIGSNVVNYPAAAQRALNNGHQLCVHTWSHPPLTTQTNLQIVAELYWTLKAIKAATGVTSKCFRPPQGDIDDRVRAIAWQMGMRTILWDEDSNDWALPSPNGGSISSNVVDGYFQNWINNYKSGQDTSGHIVLEHELSKSTVNMSIFWLPKLRKVFNIIPALSCNGITQPYWEEDFVYPLTYPSNGNAPSETTTQITSSQTTSRSTTTTGTSKGSTTTTTLTTTITVTTTSKRTSSTTTKKAPTTTSSSVKCTPGSSGRKNGDGNTGACCTSSDDCLETCRSGVCGL